jgi:hypothetical protein
MALGCGLTSVRGNRGENNKNEPLVCQKQIKEKNITTRNSLSIRPLYTTASNTVDYVYGDTLETGEHLYKKTLCGSLVIQFAFSTNIVNEAALETSLL